jgi:predicted RNA binding protein YcfA (HicA-like mRNA interferase family)
LSPDKLPIISGRDLKQLLLKNGWDEHKYRTHGCALKKIIDCRTRVTIIPNSRDPLPPGTLMAILGPKQTGIGKEGLLALLKK